VRYGYQLPPAAVEAAAIPALTAVKEFSEDVADHVSGDNSATDRRCLLPERGAVIASRSGAAR
jgi:hypothetical protein